MPFEKYQEVALFLQLSVLSKSLTTPVDGAIFSNKEIDMKKSIAMATLCVVALGLGTAGAYARDFQHADENRDGKVSWEEAFGDSPTLTRVLFNAADEDHNGSLDEAEYGLLYGLGCTAK